MARGARLGVILQRVQPTPPSPPAPEPFVPTPVVTYGEFDFPPNPDIRGLLQQAAQETDPGVKAELTRQAYVVNAPYTEAEENLFGYLEPGYTVDVTSNRQTAYVGVVFQEDTE